MTKHSIPSPKPDLAYIYRPWRRCPATGRKIWARQYGLKAWRIPVGDRD